MRKNTQLPHLVACTNRNPFSWWILLSKFAVLRIKDSKSTLHGQFLLNELIKIMCNNVVPGQSILRMGVWLGSCLSYLDLTSNSHNLFTSKWVATRRENWQSDLGYLRVKGREQKCFLSATDLNNASPLHTFKFLSVINVQWIDIPILSTQSFSDAKVCYTSSYCIVLTSVRWSTFQISANAQKGVG